MAKKNEQIKLKDERNMAEIQLVALIIAIKGFCQTKPTMTIVELNKMLLTILQFAREAKLETICKREQINEYAKIA